MVLAIDTRAFVAFDLEKVKFFAIPMRATVANVFENSFVLGHPKPFSWTRTEIECRRKDCGDLVWTQLTLSPP
jgi:hypothetical protein